MKKGFLILISFLAILFLSACSKSKNDIITTSFIGYDIAKNIVKDKRDVELLISPGKDIHSFEFSDKDKIKIKKSNLLITTSIFFDHKLYEDEIYKNLTNKISLFNLAFKDQDEREIFEKLKGHKHETHGTNEEHNHHHTHNDEHKKIHNYVHFFTSPYIVSDLVLEVAKSISNLDKQNEKFYLQNANSYANLIKSESDKFKNYLSDKNEKEIFFVGHDSFGLFEKDFNLKINYFQKNIAPEKLESDKQYLEFKNEIINDNASFIFYPELNESKYVLEKIKQDLSSKIKSENYLLLHSYHNLSINDFNENKSYLTLMISNYNNLKLAIAK